MRLITYVHGLVFQNMCRSTTNLLWDILDAADCGFELWRVGVRRDRDDNLHVVGRRSPLKLRDGVKWH